MAALEIVSEFVKRYEGFSLKSYRCPAGVWTIGHGVTGPDIVGGMVWTREQCEARFALEMRRYLARTQELLPPGLNDNQIAALTSFAYNVGVGGLANSTLLKFVRAGKFPEASREFLKWNKATVGGKKVVLNGLTARRVAEAELFLKAEGEAPAPIPQAVEYGGMKPLDESKTISAAQKGTAVAATAGVLGVLADVQTVSTQIHAITDSFPALPWQIAAGALLITVVYMVWRRIDDYRKSV